MQALSAEQLLRMTEAERREYERVLELVRQLGTPLSYMQAVSTEAVDYAHIILLEGYVMALINHCLYPSGIGPQAERIESDVWINPETGEETVQFLAITMPPRHGKSYYVSRHLPAWYLTTHPDNELILTAYEADFAQDWSDQARNLVKEHPEYGVEVDPANDAKSKWRIKGRRGAMRAAGAGGSITGKGAELLIGDDLISNSAEAFSQVMRDNLWKWYLTTYKTRRNPDGVGIMMFTRWHEDDLIGRVIENEPTQWFLLNLPALAFETTDELGFSIDPDTQQRDLLQRKPGEALCPERFPARALRRIQSGKEKAADDIEGGESTFSAMYQGKPSVEGGGIIPKSQARYELITHEGDRYGTYKLMFADGTTKYVSESDCFRVQTSDWATTDKTKSDYCVITTIDFTKTGEQIIRHVERKKMEGPDHLDWFKQNSENWKPRVRLSGIENKMGGTELIQKLRREPGTVSIVPLAADKDKIARAIPFGREVRNGTVFFPVAAPWLKDTEDEMTKFPNAAHDDIVDTLSYSIEMRKFAPAQREEKKIDNSVQARADANIAKLKNRGKGKRPNVLGRLGL